MKSQENWTTNFQNFSLWTGSISPNNLGKLFSRFVDFDYIVNSKNIILGQQ